MAKSWAILAGGVIGAGATTLIVHFIRQNLAQPKDVPQGAVRTGYGLVALTSGVASAALVALG